MNQLLRGTGLTMRSASAVNRISRSSITTSHVRAFASAPKLERQHSFVNVSPKSRHGAKTAEDAVNNILYNIPTERNTETKHTLSVLVDNATGVLSKVSGLLSARGYNIDSLTVSATDVNDLSRMTIVMTGADNAMEQAKRQLEDLVDVWAVLDYKGLDVLERELVVVKVNCVPPEGQDHYENVLGDASMSPVEQQLAAAEGDDAGAPSVSYEGLMSRHFHRQAILEIAKMFNATTVDVGSDHIMLEMVSWPKRVGAFVRLLQPFGIIEAARSGTIAMSRSPVGGVYEDLEESLRTKVNLADLPPS